jgi:glycerol-3-phosphate acyltransferase PlsX
VSQTLTVALDAMGGDHGAPVVVRGADIAAERFPFARFLLVGDQAKIEPLIKSQMRLQGRYEILHTDQAIPNEMKPSQALRQAKQSSMRLAIEAVETGTAGCVVSAGNTGALMALAKIVLKTLPGIDRPAIASFMPTERGETVMLDLGANIECDAENLLQFAIMGQAFARSVLGLKDPRVGILNVGSEELKGNDLVREAASLLRASPLAASFHGFVEGTDIAKGTVDVVVTDGFTGNVALKTAEGTARLVSHFLRQSLQTSLLAKIGALLSAGALNKLKLRMDPRRYNGGMLLGLNGVCVKSHGGTDAIGFANAIGVAVDLVQHRFNDMVSADLALHPVPAKQAAGGGGSA